MADSDGCCSAFWRAMVVPCGEVQNVNDWQSKWLGRRSLPRDLSGFEIEAFFTFCGNERRAIEERRGSALKIALAQQIGFRRKEMQAVADALSLRANLVMAWNTMQMQSILDRCNVRRATAVPPELIGRIAPPNGEDRAARGLQLPHRAIRRAAASVILGSEIRACGRLVGAQSAPRNTPSETNRTPNPINLLQRSTPKIPRKTPSRYRHFWHRNQGDPGQANGKRGVSILYRASPGRVARQMVCQRQYVRAGIQSKTLRTAFLTERREALS